MRKRPILVAVTKFVRPGSKTFGSYIGYMDRDAAINGGEVHQEYSAYSERYMGNPEKTTGLFTANEDAITPELAEKLKTLFRTAQNNGSLLWQTVISFDNPWLAEHGIYNPKEKTLDEKRIRDVARVFMKTLLTRENMNLAVWTAAVHYNTDNFHVHIAIVDPYGQRERIQKGKYAGEMKGYWKQSSIRSAKSAAINELLNLDQIMNRMNELSRSTILNSLKTTEDQKCIQEDLEALMAKLEQTVPDTSRWMYGYKEIYPYRDELDQITEKWLNEAHPQEYEELKQIWKDLELQQNEAYGDSKYGNNYAKHQKEDFLKRCGNVILKEMKRESFIRRHQNRRPERTSPQPESQDRRADETHSDPENQHRQPDEENSGPESQGRSGEKHSGQENQDQRREGEHSRPAKRSRSFARSTSASLHRAFSMSLHHYRNLADYNRQQREAEWENEQALEEEERRVREAVYLENSHDF